MRTKKRKYRRVTGKRAYARKHTKRARCTYRRRTRNNKGKRRQRGGTYGVWKTNAENIINDAKAILKDNPNANLKDLIKRLPAHLGKKESLDANVIRLITEIAVEAGVAKGQWQVQLRKERKADDTARRKQQDLWRHMEAPHISGTNNHRPGDRVNATTGHNITDAEVEERQWRRPSSPAVGQRVAHADGQHFINNEGEEPPRLIDAQGWAVKERQ